MIWITPLSAIIEEPTLIGTPFTTGAENHTYCKQSRINFNNLRYYVRHITVEAIQQSSYYHILKTNKQL